MLNLNELFDANSLPVAPEFVEALAENATKTAVEALENLHAPEHVIRLVQDIHELGFYLQECYCSPNALLRSRSNRFEIEEVVVECINLIAQAGGVFQAPYGNIGPRQIAAPMQIGGPK